MRHIHIDYQGTDLNFQGASRLAKDVAMENQMREPTILAWHRGGGQTTTPYYDGANPETWWEKYGAGNGGKLEIHVGDEYGFIMMDTRGFEELGEMPLRNLTDSEGNEYLCLTPLLGKQASQPTAEACSLLDSWNADQN